MFVKEQRPTWRSTSLVPMILIIFMLHLVKALCPNGCLCSSDTQVLCQAIGLEVIPKELSMWTEHLSLSNNSIHSVPTDSFSRLPNIKKIILDDNGIKVIHQFAFRGVKNAEEISIQKNPLNKLTTYSFSNLSGISRLYLGYNKISSIAANAFAGSDGIREILLLGNPLTTIQTSAFSSLTNIGVLYLPPSTIRIIEPDSFRGLVNVSMIQLIEVQLEQVQEYTFRGLTNVSTLELRKCDFAEISNRGFYGMDNIDYLSFEDNTFGKVESNAFQGMTKIKLFKVEGNRFEDLEESAFGPFADDTHKLMFTDNRVSCDCRLKQVLEDLTPMVPDVLEDNFCHFPDGMDDKRWSEVDLDTLDNNVCPTSALLESDEEPNVKVESTRSRDVYNSGSSPQRIPFLLSLVLLGCLARYNCL